MNIAKYLNVNGRLLDLSTPCVMGILNLTPDSFYAHSRMETDEAIAARTHQIVDEGAAIVDVGAYSSRPGAADVSAEEEMTRLRRGLEIIRREVPEAVVSVDTFRADVARMCAAFKAIGEPSRMKILLALMEGEMCVYHIAHAVDGLQSNVSHQLRLLKDAKIIRSRREGKNILYSIADEHIASIILMSKAHLHCGGEE